MSAFSTNIAVSGMSPEVTTRLKPVDGIQPHEVMHGRRNATNNLGDSGASTAESTDECAMYAPHGAPSTTDVSEAARDT